MDLVETLAGGEGSPSLCGHLDCAFLMLRRVWALLAMCVRDVLRVVGEVPSMVENSQQGDRGREFMDESSMRPVVAGLRLSLRQGSTGQYPIQIRLKSCGFGIPRSRPKLFDVGSFAAGLIV